MHATHAARRRKHDARLASPHGQECVRALGLLAAASCPVRAAALQPPALPRVLAHLRRALGDADAAVRDAGVEALASLASAAAAAAGGQLAGSCAGNQFLRIVFDGLAEQKKESQAAAGQALQLVGRLAQRGWHVRGRACGPPGSSAWLQATEHVQAHACKTRLWLRADPQRARTRSLSAPYQLAPLLQPLDRDLVKVLLRCLRSATFHGSPALLAALASTANESRQPQGLLKVGRQHAAARGMHADAGAHRLAGGSAHGQNSFAPALPHPRSTRRPPLRRSWRRCWASRASRLGQSAQQAAPPSAWAGAASWAACRAMTGRRGAQQQTRSRQRCWC